VLATTTGGARLYVGPGGKYSSSLLANEHHPGKLSNAMASFITLRTYDGEQVHVNLSYVVAVKVRRAERRATVHVAHTEAFEVQGAEFDRLLTELEHVGHLDLSADDQTE
jgi:hypothetical protein